MASSWPSPVYIASVAENEVVCGARAQMWGETKQSLALSDFGEFRCPRSSTRNTTTSSVCQYLGMVGSNTRITLFDRVACESRCSRGSRAGGTPRCGGEAVSRSYSYDRAWLRRIERLRRCQQKAPEIDQKYRMGPLKFAAHGRWSIVQHVQVGSQ